MNPHTPWGAELARGLFILAGATIAFLGVLFSQRQQETRDRRNDARALRDAKRQRLEDTYIPVLLGARSMWELVLRQGKKPEQVDIPEERDHLSRLWQRVTTDVEELLVKLSLEADLSARTARGIYERTRSEFFAYLGYRSEGEGDQDADLIEKVLASRQAVYSGLQELELLAQRQLRQLSQPLPPADPRCRKWWAQRWRHTRLMWRRP
jgi:hypothetical protein